MTRKIILSLFFILAAMLMFSLCLWQANRAMGKYHQENELSALSQMTGTFLPDRHIILIDKYFERQKGVVVVSAFKLTNSEKIMLIHRGWLAEKQLDQIKNKTPTKNAIKLTGYIDKIRSNPFILSRHEMALDSWPARQLQLRLDALEEALEKSIYPDMLRLRGDSPYSFTVLPEPSIMTWQRHLGYALQWALLSLLSLIMLGIVSRKRFNDTDTATFKTAEPGR